MIEWQPVSKEPPDYEDVLLYIPDGATPGETYHVISGYIESDGQYHDWCGEPVGPSHWATSNNPTK